MGLEQSVNMQRKHELWEACILVPVQLVSGDIRNVQKSVTQCQVINGKMKKTNIG